LEFWVVVVVADIFWQLSAWIGSTCNV
jgi:hypothetical protein